VAKAPVVPPAPPGGHKTATYQKYGSNEVGNLQATVVDLARQVAKLTGVFQQFEKLQQKMDEITTLIKLTPEATADFEQRINQLNSILEIIQARSDSIRAEFQCSHCKATNSVALHVKCTVCGEENWMGWWPGQDKEPEKK
jgi:predicted DNA-binding ArsR family transcriptional regulator